jgi:hypothetical protein
MCRGRCPDNGREGESGQMDALMASVAECSCGFQPGLALTHDLIIVSIH